MVRNSLLIWLGIMLFAIVSYAQDNRYMVFFKDKEGSSYNLNEPGDFLTERAITRRLQQGISLTEQDIPVNTNYIEGIKNEGADIFFTTRWMNGVLVQCDQTLISTIEALPYVSHVELVAPKAKLINPGRKKTSRTKTIRTSEVTDNQLNMLGIDQMHENGYRGEGMIIAIFDSGFDGVDTALPFQHLITGDKIDLSVSHDFVYNSDDVFQYDNHGTMVFSVISANEPNTFIGGAYNSEYQLYITEEVPTEYRIEEYNWLFAAERADSSGADIIQSSLGYYDFDIDAMDYPKSAMDGNTTVVSRAAQWAADRGMVIVCSAGNEGSIAWKIISAPADAVDVLAVANVNLNLNRSNSSSIGPAADGRIKPDVAALGTGTAVILPSGSTGVASGTSLAAPLITSLVAGVWQQYPQLTNKEIMDAIRRSGSQANTPDNQIGYGIPNYNAVVNYIDKLPRKDGFEVYPNPFYTDSLIIKPKNPDEVKDCRIELISSDGKIVFTKQFSFSWINNKFEDNLKDIQRGIYFLRITSNNKVFIHKVVRI